MLQLNYIKRMKTARIQAVLSLVVSDAGHYCTQERHSHFL